MKNIWKQSIESVAVLGVLFSLLLVAYQIQQANRIAVATIEIEVSNNFSSLNEFYMSHPEIAEAQRKADSGDELTYGERMLLGQWVRRMLNLWRTLETSYKKGVLPESTYQIMFADVRSIIGSSGLERRRIWRDVLDNYPSLRESAIFEALYSQLDGAETVKDQ